jgi:hypothetical protein
MLKILLDKSNTKYGGEQMSEWHKFLLTYDNIFDKAIELQNEFNSLFTKAMPHEKEAAAMMTKINRNGIIFYFTPNASSLAPDILEKHHAVQCTSPTPDENIDGYQLSFSAGDKKYFYHTFGVHSKAEH